MAIYQATLLAAENKKLQVVNEKVQKKREKKKSYVGKGGILSITEVQEAQRGPGTEVVVENQVVEPSNLIPPIQALQMYSVYRSLEHTARTCPQRPLNT